MPSASRLCRSLLPKPIIARRRNPANQIMPAIPAAIRSGSIGPQPQTKLSSSPHAAAGSILYFAVYTGNNVSNLTLVASNDNVNSGVTQSQVTIAAVAGITYHIALDGKAGAAGTAVINVDAPPNDDFANRFVISGTKGTTNGFSITASKEVNEPAHAADVGGRSIWYQWTAPGQAAPWISTSPLGSDFDTTLAVYSSTPFFKPIRIPRWRRMTTTRKAAAR